MSRYYLDSSVLLYRYFYTAPTEPPERERTDKLVAFATQAVCGKPPVAVSSLALLEARGVLSLRSRSFPQLKTALDMLDVDEAGLEVWIPNQQDWSRAMEIATVNALRGADSLQVAVFIRAREKHNDLALATSDHRMIRACKELSLNHLDPGI